MSYASYQVATDGAAPNTSNLIPEGPPKATYSDATGAVSLDGNGNLSINKPKAYNTADQVAPGATGILATAKTVVGGPCIGGITAKDIITVNNMEIAVGTAEMMGMVHKDVMGNYVETTNGVRQASTQAEMENHRAETEDLGEAFADPKAETALAEVCSAVSPSVQVAALQEIIANGQADQQTINRAASEAGIEPGQMSERLSAVVKSFETQAISAVTGYGSEDPEGFFEWAQSHQPRTLRAAAERHGMERTTNGYEPMYREYIASMADHDPKSVLNATSSTGVTVKEVGGKVLVTVPGHGPMEYRTALSAGLIKVRGA